MIRMPLTRRHALTTLAGAAFATPAFSQTGETAEAREKRLQAGAKAEGEVVVYSTSPPDDSKFMMSAFEQRYGVATKLWRSSSEDILQRAIAESRAGRPQVDCFLQTGIGLESLANEKMLRASTSPFSANLIPEAAPSHGMWNGIYLAPFVHLYNTNAIRKADLPKTWGDLLDPRWKGKLAVEAADYDWFMAICETIGRDKGLALFRDIVEKNGVSVRKGHSLLANLVVAGEVPLALTVYHFTAEQLKKSGAPVDWFVIPPAITPQVGVAVSRDARHPNAAELLCDFLLSRGQDALAGREFICARKDLAAKAPFTMKVQDDARVLAIGAEWEDLYRRTFRFR